MYLSPETSKYPVFGKEYSEKHLKLKFAGDPIEREALIKVLGLNFGYKADQKLVHTIKRQWKQGSRRLRRIVARMGGAEEKVAKRLIMATLVSKITYSARFYRLRAKDDKQLCRLINDARKTVSGVPTHANEQELRKCVFLPDIKDLLKHQEEAHKTRLHYTKEGRSIARYPGVCADKIFTSPAEGTAGIHQHHG